MLNRKAIVCEDAVWLGRICIRDVGTSGFVEEMSKRQQDGC